MVISMLWRPILRNAYSLHLVQHLRSCAAGYQDAHSARHAQLREQLKTDEKALHNFVHSPSVAATGGSVRSTDLSTEGAASSVPQPKVYMETYGCQMNVSDTEIVRSILQQNNFATTDNADEASVILLNTCAIRDNAESKIWGRLGHFKFLKKQKKQKRQQLPVVGVLGCMAERLKDKLLNNLRSGLSFCLKRPYGISAFELLLLLYRCELRNTQPPPL